MSFIRKLINWIKSQFVEDEVNDYEEEQSVQAGALPARTARPLEAVIIKPEKYSDAKKVTNELQNDKVVIVILQDKIVHEDASKFVDFMSGAVYFGKGTVEYFEDRVLICAPSCVRMQTDELHRYSDIPVWKGVDE